MPAARLRPARRDDAADIARLFNIAGHGLPSWYWTAAAAEGVDPFDLGTARAARDDTDFGWRNTTIAEVDGAVAGGLIAYQIASAPIDLDELPPVFRPLQELENQVVGATYVLALAVYPAFRCHGIGALMLEETEAAARARTGAPGRPAIAADPMLALICADGNHEALALYRARGFQIAARAPVVPVDGWSCDSEFWLLLVKPVS